MNKRRVGFIVVHIGLSWGMTLDKKWKKGDPNWMVCGNASTLFPTRSSASWNLRKHARIRGEYKWPNGNREGYYSVLGKMRIQPVVAK